MAINQFEDDKFENENWDDDQEEGSFEGDDIEEPKASSEPVPKKSSMGLVIMVLILGALGGGGYYYIKVMGGSVPFLDKIPGLSQLAQNNDGAQGDGEDNQAEAMMDELPMPQIMTDKKIEEALPESMGIETLGGDAPLQGMEMVSDGENMSNDFILPETLSSEEDGAFASADFETSDSSLSSDMDMLEDTAKNITPEVLEDSFEMASSISEKSEENNMELQNPEIQSTDLEEIAVTFEEQMSERDPVASIKDSKIQTLSEEVEEISSRKEVVVPKVKKAVVKKKAPKRKIIWVLKSAKTGKAWISEKGMSGMRVVSVGDKVDGIGRVMSIGLEDGKWVVKAKAGRISQ